MRIGLIDVDGHNFPNIPIMKLSAFHKSMGDVVEWYCPFDDRFDIVYKSKVFSFSQDWDEIINADKVIQGGSGYAIKLVNGKEIYDPTNDPKLPDNIEHIFPDYSIYGIKETAYGFLTRGCPRCCDFCHVGNKEGKCSKKVANLNEFWNGQKNIVLCDPNILACKDWKNLFQQLIDSNSFVDFNQGIDIRIMNEEKAKMLSNIKMKSIHFAWDRFNDKDIITKKLKLFSKFSKIRTKDSIVYTIVNFDTTFEQDLERIYILRDMGFCAFVMIYDKENCDQRYKDLGRWCNNRFIFSKCKTFEEYKKNI